MSFSIKKLTMGRWFWFVILYVLSLLAYGLVELLLHGLSYLLV